MNDLYTTQFQNDTLLIRPSFRTYIYLTAQNVSYRSWQAIDVVHKWDKKFKIEKKTLNKYQNTDY